ncbi:hypothetical protein L2E82_35754 [Cichorium intybus]|uniref:Uncharacterized protein n=1 Tax=Cichorium intybus TaxID=13427 RepID=A0ACB9BPQ9_CICIN|nr:hypothetical protein L2E82_35754 [Cichorium intybus]
MHVYSDVFTLLLKITGVFVILIYSPSLFLSLTSFAPSMYEAGQLIVPMVTPFIISIPIRRDKRLKSNGVAIQGRYTEGESGIVDRLAELGIHGPSIAIMGRRKHVLDFANIELKDLWVGGAASVNHLAPKSSALIKLGAVVGLGLYAAVMHTGSGKTKVEREEALRKLVVALNGLAGIASIKHDFPQAIDNA